jgi:hypothetical protein
MAYTDQQIASINSAAATGDQGAMQYAQSIMPGDLAPGQAVMVTAGGGSLGDSYRPMFGGQGSQGVQSSSYGGQSSGNLGFASQGNSQNPYLGDQANAITNQVNNNWTRNLQPSIRSGAMAAGGFGGSRQGVVEANGLNDLNQGLSNSLSNLYSSAWSQQQSNNLQQQSLNNSYDLGLRSSDLGFASLDSGIAQNNFNNQLNSANFGLNAYNTMNGQTQAGISAGKQIQNTPLDYQKYFTNSANGVGSGYSAITSSQTNPGNTALGFLGGAQLGSQIYNQYK